LLSAAERLVAEVGSNTDQPTQAKRRGSSEFDLFGEANRVSTLAVLDYLGIAHEETPRGVMATCPGPCGEDGALVCKDGGLKCLHDRCAHAGPAKNKGFRTNVDLVLAVRGWANDRAADAAREVCKRFGIDVLERVGQRNSFAAPMLPGERELDEDVGPPPEWMDEDSEPSRERTERPRKVVAWTTTAERLRSARKLGPRHPTGLPQLDVMLRGGIQVEKTMVVGGAPGAGKTSVARQIADHWCRRGVAVGWLAIDEEPAGIDARRLQSIGVPRALAEEPDEATIRLADAELSELPFHVFDELMVEDVFEAMAERYPNQPRAVVLDSLQTVATRQSAGIDSRRERIDDVVATAKRCSRAAQTAAIVLFTSELARGAYRSKQSSEQIEDLAAFKESGGIEYGGHVLLVMRTSKGDASLVEVNVPKNRVGSKGEFALRLDFETATFATEDLPQGEADPATDKRREKAGNRAAVERDAAELVLLVSKHPAGLGSRGIRDALRVEGFKWGPERLAAAMLCAQRAEGIAGNRLMDRGNGKSGAARVWCAEPAQDDSRGSNE
jgi:KaiC/GvpD/RAD55 family RecA-like ATPase